MSRERLQLKVRISKLIKKMLAVSATVLVMMAGSQAVSAKTVAPEAFNKVPAGATGTDASSKVAKNSSGSGNRNRSSNNPHNLGVGLGLAFGAIALGAAAAAAREREEYGTCRRLERRCARRYGWETRRWYNCVEDRGC